MQQTNQLRIQNKTITQLQDVIQTINNNHSNLMESKEIITQFYDKQNNDDKEIIINHLEEKFPEYLVLIQETNSNDQISFLKYDNFLVNLSSDQHLQIPNQNDDNKIKEMFDELWSKNEIVFKEKQEISFNKNCEIELLKIQNKPKKYIHKSGNQESKEQFLNNLVKKEPSKDDFDQCFDIISKDLVQQNAFDLIFTDKTAKQEINQKPLQETQKEIYTKNFKDILNQIKNFTNNDLISTQCKLSNLNVELEYISKTDLDNFFNTKENKDLSKFCENKEKKQAILQFLQFYQIFGYSLDAKKIDEVEDLVLVKKEKTLLDYLAYKDNSYYENFLNVSHQFNFLDGLNLKLQKKVIKLYEYQKHIKEFKKNQIFIIHKKLFFDEKVSISKFENYCKSDLDYGFFNEIMNFKSDWKKIYALIYDIVLKEYTNKQTLDGTAIQTIMDKLEIKIDELNQCFFKYGAILGDIGQGLLYNFATFVIWRIQCYQKYLQYTKQEQNLSVLKQEIFDRFLVDIKQDQNQQSFLNGKVIANEIIDQLIRQYSVNFAIDAREELNKLVTDPKMQSFYLIDEFDTKLFNESQKQNSYYQTLYYINNPVDFIVNEVNQRINKIREEFTTKYNQKLNETSMSNLNLLLQKLQKISQQVTTNTQAIELFIQLDNPDDAPKILYQIMMGYLRGTLTQEQLSNIQDKFKNIFSNPDNICKIGKDLTDQKYQKIYSLSDFISGFINAIQKQMNNINLLKVETELYEQQIQKIRLNLIGCRQCCPTCKRKCDQDNVDGHRHRSSNGHLVRAMAGIIVNDMTSVYQCEEIKQDYQVKEFNKEAINSMDQVKQIYQDWVFSDQIDQKIKDKFNAIWKNIGKDICYYRFNRDEKRFNFVENQQNFQVAQQPSFHYIILLDDSGSMSGDRFNQAQNGLISFLSLAKDNQNIRVTVIIFNDNARCVVDFQTINMQTIKNAVVCNGGGTSFQSAFQLAYEKIVAVKNFDQFNKHVIFFYTDGGDSYPAQALDQFARLPSAQRMKIDLIACCLDKQQKTMIDITEFFSKNCSCGKLQDQMEPSQIGEAWRNQIKFIIV